MKAVILAAGKGVRLGQITQSLPKPMLPVGGEPILEHLIKLCRKNGVEKIFVNLHHKSDAIKNYFGDGSKWGVSISYKLEKALLGTSGAVKNFEAELGQDPFFVLYGDNYMDYDLKSLMKKHVESKADMSIAVFELPDTRESGAVSMDTQGRIVKFAEKQPSASAVGGWVNSGVYVMNAGLLAKISAGYSDFGKDVIPQFIQEGLKIAAIKMDQAVKAIDTPALYQKWVGDNHELR